VRLLTGLGYPNVRHYAGGLAEWMQASPVVSPSVANPPSGGAHAALSRGPALPPASGAAARFVYALADRPVGALFRLWLEIVVGCGAIYWILEWTPSPALEANGVRIAHDIRGLFSALYFSAVTATSVGYGDILPTGVARLLAIVESAAGLLIFGVLISKFVSRRQEEVLAEIHRIAFEDRLGRLRTNLHLVRTELQTTAQLCEGQEIAPPAAVARVESVAMVFLGELRAVHDLLYRPQQAPDEPVLEMILASLASVFREMSELLRCIDVGQPERSPTLHASLSSMARLAREICGDCVPREYAPALRRWMDQIQGIAGEIAQL
jgi:ion channel